MRSGQKVANESLPRFLYRLKNSFWGIRRKQGPLGHYGLLAEAARSRGIRVNGPAAMYKNLLNLGVPLKFIYEAEVDRLLARGHEVGEVGLTAKKNLEFFGIKKSLPKNR